MTTTTRTARQLRPTDATEAEAFDALRKMFPKGSTVYTVLDGSPSSSGMTRWINVYAIKRNQPVYATGRMFLAWPKIWGKRGGMTSKHPNSLRVTGCGMDMGFDVAYTLSRLLYGDGYALSHRWIG